MTNNNYNKGSNFERAIVADLQMKGFFAIRSAGSHSPIDVIAIRKGEVWGVQAKLAGYVSRDDKTKLLNIMDKFGIKPMIATKKRDGRMVYIDYEVL